MLRTWSGSILCLPMSNAEIIFSYGPTSVSPVLHTLSMVNAVPAVGLVPMAFNHQQTWYGNYILYAESYHVINV